MVAHRTTKVDGLSVFGHFAVEDSLEEIVAHITRFYDEKVEARPAAGALERAGSVR